ncbi:MAG: restriction endonuclease subunit S [Verrucomicrobiales bacterium]|nr:restriction endonuclease subunit S [Verrucomicrobiales bacterium]
MAGDWEEQEVVVLLREGALLINDGYRAQNSELSNTGLPFARAGNIDGGFHFVDADRVPAHILTKVGLKRSLPGDVVFTSKGTVGRFAFVREETPEFVYSPQLCYWRSNDVSRIHPRWLFYWMNGREFFLQFKGVAGQTDMAEYVSLRDQRAMRITLPPLPTQRAIAHVLGTLDDLIELNRETNEILEEMARALFKSWFVDYDPVRAKLEGRQPAGMRAETAKLFPDHFQDSQLGQIPLGWEVRSLDKIAHYLNGLALQKYPPGNGPTLPVIKIAQLRKGDTEGADRCNTKLPPEYVVQDGDVIFSWSGSLEVELWCGGPGALNQHLFKVTSPEFPKWFYYLWTLYHLDEFRLIAADKATTMGHIQRGHLTAAKVLIPPPPLLDAMTCIMSPIINQIIANRTESRTLAALRDTLLPKLLSGELSVAELESKLSAKP